MKTFLGALLAVAVTLAILRVLAESALQGPRPADPPRPDRPSPMAAAAARASAALSPPNNTFLAPLGGSQAALLARVQLAEMATRSVDAQYYLFHDDEAGRALLGALIGAAERGVRVRLLLDDMDSHGREGLFAALSAQLPTLSIRVFNPTWLRRLYPLEYLSRFPVSSRRMHNKSLTADRALSVVGGRNVGNEYFHLDAHIGFDDLDVLAGGEVASATSAVFERYWDTPLSRDAGELGEPLAATALVAERRRIDADYRAARAAIARLSDSAVAAIMADSPAYPTRARVIADPPEKVRAALGDTTGTLAPQVLAAMRGAREELLIVSPYFIPGETGLQTFAALRERGVAITIVTNSLAANDVAAVHAGYARYRRRLLALGVALHEVKPDPVAAERELAWLGSQRASLHAKTFLVDRERNFVGSFNLDPRSAIHNTEMGVLFDQADYARAARAGLQRYLRERTWALALDDAGELRWHDHSGAGAAPLDEEPQTDAFTRAAVREIALLPVEWLL